MSDHRHTMKFIISSTIICTTHNIHIEILKYSGSINKWKIKRRKWIGKLLNRFFFWEILWRCWKGKSSANELRSLLSNPTWTIYQPFNRLKYIDLWQKSLIVLWERYHNLSHRKFNWNALKEAFGVYTDIRAVDITFNFDWFYEI